jgi:hypothetical protein
VQTRLDAVESRLAALEQRAGTGPDTSDLDEQIDRGARQEQWAAEHSALPDLAERVQQLTDEVERLRVLLRQHGIDPQDKPA